MIFNYRWAVEWLYSFRRYGSKLGLERISYLAEKLGNPQKDYKVIHVGGTNGKGSVCNLIGSILQKAGYNVGIYTSPHLQRFSERIVVNNKEISEEDVVSLVKRVKPIVDEMRQQKNNPTFFEVVTAMAFQFFSDQEVDFAVIEVGLGGRHDATNIVEPIVSIITNVSLEHTDILGEKLEEIASEKAGIIKENGQVITAAEYKACRVIQRVSKEQNASLTIISRENWRRKAHNMRYQKFFIKGALADYNVKTPLLGEHQGENIALAIAAIEKLQMQGIYVPNSSITTGISTTHNPGRMEIISRNPVVLLDGAHNSAGISMLKKTLQDDFRYNKMILVIGIMKDKDVRRMLSIVIPISDYVVATQPNMIRASHPRVIEEIIKRIDRNKKVVSKETISDAMEHAISNADKDDLVCVTGSLFTVGEARDHILNRTNQ